MQNREDIEAWADALLDQHRTAPPRPQRDPEALEQAIDDLPPLMRWSIRQSDNPPDPDMIERLHRSVERTRRLENAQGVVTLIGMIALGAFVLSVYSTF